MKYVDSHILSCVWWDAKPKPEVDGTFTLGTPLWPPCTLSSEQRFMLWGLWVISQLPRVQSGLQQTNIDNVDIWFIDCIYWLFNVGLLHLSLNILSIYINWKTKKNQIILLHNRFKPHWVGEPVSVSFQILRIFCTYVKFNAKHLPLIKDRYLSTLN